MDRRGNRLQRTDSAGDAEPALVLLATGPQAELPLVIQPIRAGPAADDDGRTGLVADVASWQHDSRPRGISIPHHRFGGHGRAAAAGGGPGSGSAGRRKIGPRVGSAGRPAHCRTAEVRARRRRGSGVAHAGVAVSSAGSGRDLSCTTNLRRRNWSASSALSEVYWQIVLPGDRHVVRSPAQLVPVEPWQWLEVFWGRHSTKTQAELETWVGATNQLAPSATENAYLFSGLAPVASIEVLTAPRWLIVLAASGAVLALASLWMYVPHVRRGWIGILAAVLVAGLAVAYPTPAVLLGQASVLGWILATIAVVLRRWLARPAPRPPSTPGSTNLRLRSSYRAESVLTPPVGPSGSGTPIVPLAVPDTDR